MLLNLLPWVVRSSNLKLAAQMLACFKQSPMLVPVQHQDPHLHRLEVRLRAELGHAQFEAASAQGKTANIMQLAQQVVRQFNAQ